MSFASKVKQAFSSSVQRPSVTPPVVMPPAQLHSNAAPNAAAPPPPGLTAMTAAANIPWGVSLSAMSASNRMMSGMVGQAPSRGPWSPLKIEKILGPERQDVIDRLLLLDIEVEYANEVEYMLVKRKPQWRTTRVPVDAASSFWMAAIEYLASPK